MTPKWNLKLLADSLASLFSGALAGRGEEGRECLSRALSLTLGPGWGRAVKGLWQ